GTMTAMTSTFFFQAEVGIRDFHVTGVQTCALPILPRKRPSSLLVPRMVGTSISLPSAKLSSMDWVFIWPSRMVRTPQPALRLARSEERRVGKESRSRVGAHGEKKKRDVG